MDKEALTQALDALERLMRMFQIERILYLFASFASVLLFVYASFRIFSSGEIEKEDLIMILGSTSVSTACSGRVGFFLNKSFKLIEDIIRKMTSTGASS